MCTLMRQQGLGAELHVDSLYQLNISSSFTYIVLLPNNLKCVKTSHSKEISLLSLLHS